MNRTALLLAGWACLCAATVAHAQNAAGAAAPAGQATEKPSRPFSETLGAGGSQADTTPTVAATEAPGPAVLEKLPVGANIGPVTRPQVRVGDEWIYRRGQGATRVLIRQRVTQVSEEGISLMTDAAGSTDTSTAVYDREWGLRASGFNTYAPALAYYAFPLYPGKRWGIDSTVDNFGAGQASKLAGEGVAAGFEIVDTQAGRFVALKVQITIETTDPGDAARRVRVRETHWYSRDILRAVKVESVTQIANEAPRQETVELLRYRIE